MSQRDLAFYLNPLDPQLSDRLAWLRDRGVHLIGLDGMSQKGPEVIGRVAEIIERAGLRVVSVHGEPGLATLHEDPKELRAAHLAVLERAVAWHAEQVVHHFRMLSLPWREGVWWEEAAFISKLGLDAYDRRVADFLTWLCEEAARRRLVIALENVTIHYPFGYRVEEIVAMIDQIGAPNLGICLDSGHAHASNLDVADAVGIAGPHLTTTHLNDNFGGGDARASMLEVDRHLVPGLGTINWPAVIRSMEGVGYRGPAVFEGVNLGTQTGGQDWQTAVEMTIANWRTFEHLAASLQGVTSTAALLHLLP